MNEIIIIESIQKKIFLIRGSRVMLAAEVVANCDHLKNLKYSPTLPYAFTEHGAIMLATVLSSPIAIEASILAVRSKSKCQIKSQCPMIKSKIYNSQASHQLSCH